MTTIDDMSEHERLAAYLSGDLDAAERAETEAALEERPELRARLDAVREVDDALAALPRATPRDGFAERLGGAVDDALRDQLDDELAARRRERTLPRWALPAAAAALVALVVGAGVAGQLVGGSDSGGDLEAVTDTLDGRTAAPDPAAGAVPEQLPVTSTGRDYDEEEARDLLGDGRFGALAGLRVGEDEARTLTEDLLEGLPAPAPEPEGLGMPEDDPPAQPGRPADPDGGTTDDGTAQEGAPTREGAVTGGVGAVSHCLPRLLGSTSGPVVPAFAELASFRGEPAVIYGLLRPGPDDPALTGREIWILDRATCTVRYFAPAPSG